MRVLIVDDDTAFAAVLTQQLGEKKYVVDRVADGETGWAYGSTFDYDLVILDWMLPRLNGIQLCQRFRQQGFDMPILLLTAKDHRTDKIRGLESGADDYMVKPFDIEELAARLRALVRRGQSSASPLLCWGDLCLDPDSCAVSYKGQPLSLTTKEYTLLELFLRNTHRVFSSESLLNRIWSSEDFPSEATVRSHIRGLRRKLKAGGAPADLIETVHGRGYRLQGHTSTVNSTDTSDLSSTENTRQSRYLAGLVQAWEAHKSESIERWQELSNAIDQINLQDIREQERSHFQHIAHSLAGTLGTFGLVEGHRLALQIEQLFRVETGLLPVSIVQIKTLVSALGHALDATPTLAQSGTADSDPHPDSIRRTPNPNFLIIDINRSPYTHQLMALAIARGYNAQHATSLDQLNKLLQLPSPITTTESGPCCPFDILLVNLVCNQQDTLLDEVLLQQQLRLMERIAEQWPQLPVVVVTPQADFGNRLDLIRRGGGIVLEYPVVPTEVLEIAARATCRGTYNHKIMLVDDDTHYLQKITQWLKPWKFQITPLSNPRRFWSLFSQARPDLIVLDIEMPHINGFELCQVLRSDPKWQHIPVVFHSIHSDPATQDRAFALGADDFIAKPIKGQDLAQRLLNRIRLTQARLSLQIS